MPVGQVGGGGQGADKWAGRGGPEGQLRRLTSAGLGGGQPREATSPESTGPGTYVGQLADCVCFHCDVVLLQLLLDFIDALRDILCLKEEKK